jgi:hypothetical protein
MYSSRPRCALAAAAALMLAAEFAVAQSKPAANEPAKPRTVRLTLAQAAAPSPALKYLLLPPIVDQSPGNAEAMLQTATNLLPNDTLNAPLRDKMNDWLKLPVADLPRSDVDKLLASMKGSLRYATLGARREYCHWDIALREEGSNAMLPSLGALRQIARGLALRARLSLADGHVDDALGDIQTLAGVARYVGDGPTVLHTLVGVAIENLAADQLDLWAETKGSPNLYWALVRVPHPLVDPWSGLQVESAFMLFDFPEFARLDQIVLPPENIKRIWVRMTEMRDEFTSNTPDDWKSLETLRAATQRLLPASRKYLLAHGRTAEQLEKLPPEQIVLMHSLDRYHYWVDEQHKCFGLPYWQLRPLLKEVEERIEKARADKAEGLFTPLLPDLSRAAATVAGTERRLAMLRVVEAIRMYAAGHKGRLPETLDTLEVPVPLDNTTGKAFDYGVHGDTATLRSTAEPTGGINEVIAYELRIAPAK